MLKVSAEKGQQAIALILRYGSQISTLIMALGIILWLAQGLPSSLSAEKGIPAVALLSRIVRLDSAAVTELGIITLLLTPVFRIIVAAASFALEREYKYVLISLGVLAVLLLSIAFAIG